MKKSFTLAEMSGCVNEVVGYVFINGTDTIYDYHPEYFDFALKYCVATYLGVEFNEDLDAVARKLNGLKFKIFAFKHRKLIKKVKKAAQARINAILSYLANKTDINAMVNKVTSVMESMNLDVSQIDIGTALSAFEKINNISDKKIIDALVGGTKGTKKK